MAQITTRRGYPLDQRPYLRTILQWGTDGTYQILEDEIFTGQGYGGIASISLGSNKKELQVNFAAPHYSVKWLSGKFEDNTSVAPLSIHSVGTQSWGYATTNEANFYTPMFMNVEESSPDIMKIVSQGDWKLDGVAGNSIEFRFYPAVEI